MSNGDQIQNTEAQAGIKRQVVVVTGFGGENRDVVRRAILNVMHVKYLVESRIKVTQQGGAPNNSLSYNVGVFRAPVGNIAEDALEAIDSADVLIALITEQNINVIFEIAVRNLLHDEFLILLRGDAMKILPIYLHNMAHIEYETSGSDQDEKTIQKQIDSIATAPLPTLDWNALDKIPEELANAINLHGRRLESDLQKALQTIEDGPPRRPAFLRNLVKDLDPGRLLSSWITYLPYSVLRIRWKHRSGDHYSVEDLQGDIIVYSANEAYLRLFDMATEFPDPDGVNALTFGELMTQINDYVDRRHMDKFKTDQKEATEKIIFEGRFATVQVPLRFNRRHPHHPNSNYLPHLVAKRIVGDIGAPHSMFILITFIPI